MCIAIASRPAFRVAGIFIPLSSHRRDDAEVGSASWLPGRFVGDGGMKRRGALEHQQSHGGIIAMPFDDIVIIAAGEKFAYFAIDDRLSFGKRGFVYLAADCRRTLSRNCRI
jgi:hypothetical protein